MSFEQYTQIYNGEPCGTTVRPRGKAFTLSFDLHPKADKQYRLFTVGETEQYYLWKNEPDYPRLYHMITDALDTGHAIKDRYCLSLTCAKYAEERKRVYKKVMWKPILSYLQMNPVPTDWEAGLVVSAKGLSFRKGGFLRMRIDVRLKRDGVDPRDVSVPCDESTVIDIPAGSYVGERLCVPIQIPENTAHVGVFIEGKGYRGACYVEQPFLSAAGQNLLPSFNESVQDCTHMDWSAQYLSRKELPAFKVTLNGKLIYRGEIFERCHRHSEWEISLPSNLLREHNLLSCELISDYHDPLPYTFYEVGVIEQPSAALSILAVSHAAPVGGKARVLVRTERPNLRVSFLSECEALSGKAEWSFREKGLHGMLLDCNTLCENAAFRLVWEDGEASGCVERIVHKTEDGVITGTGDMVYIKQDAESMEEYLAWYFSNGIGDFITIRPVYRWSGTKHLDRRVFERFCRLMRELDMKYVLMADGRELPGISAQPDEALLRGEGFLGVQQHERDGAQFYWDPKEVVSLFDEQVKDLMHYAYLEDPAHTGSHYNNANYHYRDGGMNVYADRRLLDDYRDEHQKCVASLRAVREGRDTRHTGPASTFKYMAEAGYTWLGAETMYQTMEPIMGFLRGVAAEYGMPTYGVHHAVQWSSTPHESPARYRRYRLALYASYLLGANDVNTEEGLWHLEEYYDHHHRFGNACKQHLKQQQDFYKYVSTHTRSGRFYTPLALVHGRDDGITFFGKNKTWGHWGYEQTVAEDSWDLLTAVYPKALPVDTIYLHPCPDDKPVGYHTGTPYGNLDVIPAEGRAEILQTYGAAIFMGYHRCESADATKYAAYLQKGGRVLLTDAHLAVTSSRNELLNGNITVRKNALVMTENTPKFVTDTVDGIALRVCSNPLLPDEVRAYTDGGRPLVCVYRIGDGELTVFHAKEYPAHPAIRALYEKEIQVLCQTTVDKEPIWAETGDDVEFALYRQADGTCHVYFLAVDWYRSPTPMRTATLRLGKTRYALPVPFGVMLKCVATEEAALLAESEDGEVVSLKDGIATVQGTGTVSFRICKNGEQHVASVDFTGGGLRKIPL